MTKSFEKHSDVSPRDLKRDNIFLTGATGILGAHILKELIRSTDSQIYCLVRAETEALAQERLLGFLNAYDPRNHLRDEFYRRVTPILGNIADENLGIEKGTYKLLTEKIDVTIHAAALTNLFLSFKRIGPINVGGTENAIRFALATSQKYLCYISTHTVMGDKTFDKKVSFKETDFDIGQGFQDMNYQYSKFTAEKLVREARLEGLRWNIMRPGQIFGESLTGYYPQGQTNVSGLFYDIFKTVIETGVALSSKTHFDVVPVDYVSQGCLRLCFNADHFYKTYHFTNPDVKTYDEVIQLLNEQGYRIRVVPQEKYKELLLTGKLKANNQEYKSSTTSAFKWWYKRKTFDFSEGAVTDCRHTASLMESENIRCPKVNSDLISAYVEKGIRENYFPRPPVRETSYNSELSQFVL